MVARGGAYFPYITIKKILKLFLSETLDQFPYDSSEMFLW